MTSKCVCPPPPTSKVMTALVTLKTVADQQSAWGCSLRVVQVVVQCVRQYTENSPGCSTAEYTNIEGRRQYTTQSWKALLARWTVTHFSNWQYRYTDYSMPFAENQSSQCSRWHTSIVLPFFLPKKPEPIHVLWAMWSSNNFSSFIPFGQSLKHLSADHLRYEHRCFYMVSSVGLVSYMYLQT